MVKTTLRLLLRWTLTHNKNFYSMRKTKMNLREQIEVAQSQSFSKMSGVYLCPELSMPAVRPGADDHQEHPSRRNNKLIYKDGREVKVK